MDVAELHPPCPWQWLGDPRAEWRRPGRYQGLGSVRHRTRAPLLCLSPGWGFPVLTGRPGREDSACCFNGESARFFSLLYPLGPDTPGPTLQRAAVNLEAHPVPPFLQLTTSLGSASRCPQVLRATLRLQAAVPTCRRVGPKEARTGRPQLYGGGN